MQLSAALRIERLEELVLQLLDHLADLVEGALAVGRDTDDVAAAILRIPLACDQATRLERVEEGDEPAGVESERVGDRRLRCADALGQDRQDAVVVDLEPFAVEPLVAFALNPMPSRASRKPLLATSSFATRWMGRMGISVVCVVIVESV